MAKGICVEIYFCSSSTIVIKTHFSAKKKTSIQLRMEKKFPQNKSIDSLWKAEQTAKGEDKTHKYNYAIWIMSQKWALIN